MFESTASALAFVFGLIAIGLNFLGKLNVYKLGATIIIVIFLLFQISCLDMGDCDVLAYAHALIPLALCIYFIYTYVQENGKKDKQNQKVKDEENN
jgi:hypothetical protein